MFIFTALYIGAMFFVQKHYNYDWTPLSPKQKLKETIEEVLIKEGSPTPINADLQDTPINNNEVFKSENISEAQQELLLEQEEQPTKQDSLEDTTLKEDSLIQENTIYEENQPEMKLELEQNSPQETTITQNITEEQTPEIQALTLEEQLKAANLVDIKSLHTKVFLRMKYATTNNFTEKKLYKRAKCYLKKPVAQALVRAAKMAVEEEVPFWLCIYDCYRPTSVQKIMLKSVKEQGFLSKVSNHSRGMAVDVGPCDMQGEPLLTPTAFDTFSDAAGAYYYGDEIPEIAIQNRTYLQEVMKKAGFNTISNEWWHFDYKGAKQEEPLDIRF